MSIWSKALRKSSRTTFAVAPFSSVLTSQFCVMLTKACVVDDLRIVLNRHCRGSIFCNTAGLTYFSATWSLASLEKIGDREMGQRCLLISFMGLCFGIGATSASFQDSGRWDSWNEQLRISETGPTSAKQRNGGIFRVFFRFCKKAY